MITISFPIGAGQLPLLPTDPVLIRSTPTLPSLGDLGSWLKLPSSETARTTSSVITEGIPPIPTKLLERIQKWEFVDLASLLASDQAPDDVVAMHGSKWPAPASDSFGWSSVWKEKDNSRYP